MYTIDELRKKYLDFFRTKDHAVILSSSLIPDNDPTALFTTAGMHPLVPYLMGERHPEGKRLADVQKCIRTKDIDEVGDNRHLTFFEMLGNWSLGDYFKKEAIEWSWEFLTGSKWLNLDPKRIYVTVFAGDENSDTDNESIEFWKKQYSKFGIVAETCPYDQNIKGKKEHRIFTMPASDNWWGPVGETGPCGPCTEIYYDVSPEKGSLQNLFEEEVSNFRLMEVWNNVFMEFNKLASGKFEKLSQKNVDTGMGLERTVAVLNGSLSAFDTDAFYPIFSSIEKISGKKYKESEDVTKAMRIIVDHVKASVMIMGDDKGISPSNTGQGYVLRRLIRRAMRYGKILGITDLFINKIAATVIDIYGEQYPELLRNRNFIKEQINIEEEKFTKTLKQGEQIFNKMIISGSVSGKDAFVLFSTYGFPFELTQELADSKGCKINEDEFNKEMEKHAKLSKTASSGMFKGGLADTAEDTKKLHTAAHLMLESLRRILGDHVSQKGSNITSERLRFDFSHPEKLTPEQIKKVEDMVNEQISKKLPVTPKEMTLSEARDLGANGVFDSKYGEKVKVYFIGNNNDFFSKEICGGPHVNNTDSIGKFEIKKEESSSAGVRRIKAVIN